MEGTLREQIQEWWKAAIDGVESFDPELLTDAATTEFRQDGEFCSRFLDEFLRDVVRETGRRLLGQQRRAISRIDDGAVLSVETRETSHAAAAAPRRHITTHDITEIIERQAPAEPVRTWRDWFEIDPSSGNRIQLYYMTKPQVLAAARRRENDIQGNLRAIAFLYLIAGKMEEGQMVKDRWTDRQLHQIETDIEIERVRYTLKQLRKDALPKGDEA